MIRESVHDVKLTLLATVVLVVLVIFLFLRNVSATIIPSLAIPGSIVATFAVMYQLGYSLNNLSLMALTLSVGFVVDNTIVMLENIVRHMEMGKSPHARRVRRVAGSRVHDSGDDPGPDGGVHPRALHGRHRRAAAARVRGHDQRGDPGVGLHLDQPDADDVQPVPLEPRTTRSTAGSTTRPSACSTPGSGCTTGRCAARCDSVRRRWSCPSCCWSPPCISSRSCRRGSCRARIRAASTSTPKAPRVWASRRWSGTSSRSSTSSRRIRISSRSRARSGSAADRQDNSGQHVVELKPRVRTRRFRSTR